MKFETLEKKVISYMIVIKSIFFLFILALYICGIIFIPNEFLLAYLIPTTVIIVIVILYTFLFPYLLWERYKYYIDEDKVIVSEGFLFKHYVVIPDVQIQDISIFQGPIQMAYDIASISISTAGSVNKINYVKKEKAEAIVEELRQRVTERLKQKEEKNA